MKTLLFAIAVLLTGCATAPTYVSRQPPQVIYQVPLPQQVSTVYLDPPLYQPPPVRVLWAPPPMRVDIIPFQPNPEAIWTGGYWVWQGNWVWAHGRWAAPPQPGYGWINPYYENRGGSVIFINGFWAAPGVTFVQPAPTLFIDMAVIGRGVIAGPRPIGPQGIFVPPPPGSRIGLIVPAPLGTAPAVVINAPAVINEGMRIHTNTTNVNNVNNSVNNSVTNVRNVTNISNIIVAPASATANGQAVNTTVAPQAHLVAAMPAPTRPLPLVPAMPPAAVRQPNPFQSPVQMPPPVMQVRTPALPQSVAPPVPQAIEKHVPRARPDDHPTQAAPVPKRDYDKKEHKNREDGKPNDRS
ncbi:hypothetical protein QN362_13765 [Actimicrobium sp. CCC2.4]|uniref:YXWGXW repeat-containing protein n=1 Tax=Actimicrobium sp. CCC2.4 TaxID=3048606 RepID=UPI002AC8C8D1|nr:hypothetical protein [Actimicrobium sp. CCC2.4]MEB0136403.1 hypothetical protein [Actimicrobium sp. CCC2.4]WPX31222.1 hypothetical protein RHM62_13320 [Actimicrobium sp. CCC2.4]